MSSSENLFNHPHEKLAFDRFHDTRIHAQCHFKNLLSTTASDFISMQFKPSWLGCSEALPGTYPTAIGFQTVEEGECVGKYMLLAQFEAIVGNCKWLHSVYFPSELSLNWFWAMAYCQNISLPLILLLFHLFIKNRNCPIHMWTNTWIFIQNSPRGKTYISFLSLSSGVKIFPIN